MAWNEPGGGDKDPWSGRGREQGPPDLDELVRKMQDRFGGLFGGRKKGGAGRPDGAGLAGTNGRRTDRRLDTTAPVRDYVTEQSN